MLLTFPGSVNALELSGPNTSLCHSQQSHHTGNCKQEILKENWMSGIMLTQKGRRILNFF